MSLIIEAEDEKFAEFQIELQIDSERIAYINKINELYDNVIENFFAGNLKVYDSNILRCLTRDKFMDWIIYHNPDLNLLFNFF
ncbi:hypothetical protein [Acanthamoeba castellanii mimivirus]|uniref:Uncharacterized protein n=3 Tax=Mimivirus TaxID=315393 RepID=E3VYG4_MIMIV|nr:hypothetical protein MIMI_gp0528 [Acanthamoeba polyphaga mimivirus]AEQ60681.1 hypothetical protein [Acanthamoeba castellanii mamavirus]AHA45366.1 hypothetical protein HIRU_S460 [Hirudovirus strain Sangsue]AHJ40161.1 hypothetical protein [Samba virus]BAV61598.1 hypothetical protein [Acanthamoeba castellanii mimivirus]ADO18233.1 hypothetical protein [Acanthamoeba polyphaga mimivirus]